MWRVACARGARRAARCGGLNCQPVTGLTPASTSPMRFARPTAVAALPWRAATAAARIVQPCGAASRRGAASVSSAAPGTALLFKLTGRDHLGLLGEYSQVLSRHDAKLLDIEQGACETHSTFTLNMLVAATDNSDSMVMDMLRQSQQDKIKLDVVVVGNDELRGDDKPTLRHALTLLKKDMGFDVISKVARAAAEHGLNVTGVDRLSPLVPQDITAAQGGGDEAATDDVMKSLTAVELILEESSTTSVQDFKAHLARIQPDLACDRAFQREGSLRRNKRLVVMDMDSTLIINEVIDEIARLNGVFEQVSEVTERAMNGAPPCKGNPSRAMFHPIHFLHHSTHTSSLALTCCFVAGELDFNESLVERVKCLAGAPESVFDDVYEVISLTPGAPEFIWALKTMGYKVAVVSGGFNQVTDRVAADMGIDFAFANTLEVVDGKLTGRTVGPIVNRERKRDLVESLAQTMQIDLEQVHLASAPLRSSLILSASDATTTSTSSPLSCSSSCSCCCSWLLRSACIYRIHLCR